MSSDNTSTLILGGARSGKSRYAQQLAERCSAQRVFIATAEALDDEMQHRIERHIADRGDSWRTVEEPLDLVAAIELNCKMENVVVVDCLTLWLSNVMLGGLDVNAECERLAESVAATDAPLIVVSNEVGMGIVPESTIGREFRDYQGRLNQLVAASANSVVLVAAGIPLVMKP